jgi:hypothetical protein
VLVCGYAWFVRWGRAATWAWTRSPSSHPSKPMMMILTVTIITTMLLLLLPVMMKRRRRVGACLDDNGDVRRISMGNGEQSLSREVYRLSQTLDFFRLLSFYYSACGSVHDDDDDDDDDDDGGGGGDVDDDSHDDGHDHVHDEDGAPLAWQLLPEPVGALRVRLHPHVSPAPGTPPATCGVAYLDDGGEAFFVMMMRMMMIVKKKKKMMMMMMMMMHLPHDNDAALSWC